MSNKPKKSCPLSELDKKISPEVLKAAKIKGEKMLKESRLKKRFSFSEKELLLGLDAHTGHADELAVVSGKELGK